MRGNPQENQWHTIEKSRAQGHGKATAISTRFQSQRDQVRGLGQPNRASSLRNSRKTSRLAELVRLRMLNGMQGLHAPVLITLSGLPFAGKSSLAHELEHILHLKLITYDQIWQAYVAEYDSWPSWDQATNVAHTQIVEALCTHDIVLYDNLGDTKWYRAALREIAKGQDASFGILFVYTPSEIRLERWRENSHNPHRHKVTKDRVESEAYFDPPTSEESDLFVRVSPNVKAGEVAERLQHFVYGEAD
jgi:predicted kinase